MMKSIFNQSVTVLGMSALLFCSIQGCTNKQITNTPPAAAATPPAPAIKFMPEKVNFPADYQAKMKSYVAIDRNDTKEIRRMYATEETLNLKDYASLPYGTQIVMVHEKPKMENGEFVRDENDRFISTGEVTKISVMQKGKDWGSQYPDYVRNGEWEHAVFNTKGEIIPTKLENCMICHTSRESQDYNFSLYEWKKFKQSLEAKPKATSVKK